MTIARGDAHQTKTADVAVSSWALSRGRPADGDSSGYDVLGSLAHMCRAPASGRRRCRSATCPTLPNQRNKSPKFGPRRCQDEVETRPGDLEYSAATAEAAHISGSLVFDRWCRLLGAEPSPHDPPRHNPHNRAPGGRLRRAPCRGGARARAAGRPRTPRRRPRPPRGPAPPRGRPRRRRPAPRPRRGAAGRAPPQGARKTAARAAPPAASRRATQPHSRPPTRRSTAQVTQERCSSPPRPQRRARGHTAQRAVRRRTKNIEREREARARAPADRAGRARPAQHCHTRDLRRTQLARAASAARGRRRGAGGRAPASASRLGSPALVPGPGRRG